MRLVSDNTPYTLYCSSYHPRIHIAEVPGKRRAQIVATLMAERFPTFSFGYGPSPIVTAPNTNHFLEIGVNTTEMHTLTEKQLQDEAEANPDGLEKWLIFIFANGAGEGGGPQISAYLEHDHAVVKRCKADPTLVETTAFYRDQPKTADLERILADWVAAHVTNESQNEDEHHRFNCLNPSQTLDDFSAFYVAPCRNDYSQAETAGSEATEFVQCGPADAEFWTIYGSDTSDNGCTWVAVHDVHSATEVVRMARQINAETGKPFFYRDEVRGCIPPNGARIDFVDITEALTEAIHDDLPDLAADNFARVDDFDAHPLAPLREAFVMFSDYAGLKTAADPYHPWEASA